MYHDDNEDKITQKEKARVKKQKETNFTRSRKQKDFEKFNNFNKES